MKVLDRNELSDAEKRALSLNFLLAEKIAKDDASTIREVSCKSMKCNRNVNNDHIAFMYYKRIVTPRIEG